MRSKVSERGRDAVLIGVDASVADEVDRMVETVEETLGDVSILVNNAGIARPQSPDEITEAGWDEVIDVNL